MAAGRLQGRHPTQVGGAIDIGAVGVDRFLVSRRGKIHIALTCDAVRFDVIDGVTVDEEPHSQLRASQLLALVPGCRQLWTEIDQ